VADYIGAIDQGTTSTRFLVFDRAGTVVSSAQEEHQQIFPRPGWVEHNPEEIWRRTQSVIARAIQARGLRSGDLAAIGITNQRETTILWNRKTGKPLYNAIVWQDTRVAPMVRELSAHGGQERYRAKTGLPLATYFSALKMRWILENVPGARAEAEAGEVLAGTMDTFLIWNLTGGPNGGVHMTDVTNASRTQLMNIQTLAWDESLLEDFGVPIQILAKIRSSSEVYGRTTISPLPEVAIAGDLGDQQAALVGQVCFEPGEAKNTYGTGCFMLLNTGEKIVPSKYGLISTVAYRLGSKPACYALEGSIAIAGALVEWLRDNLGLIESSAEITDLASSVQDNGGIYFVPAFSGLYAPYWKDTARGVIAGLTRYVNRGHFARAALEATAFQVREIVEAMMKDSAMKFDCLRVDGGMVRNDLLMQFQADILGMPVVCPRVSETTALGAGYAAGLAAGFFKDTDELRANWKEQKRWQPKMEKKDREHLYRYWKKTVARSMDWLE
jgi:glycerol kinase